MNGLTQSVDRFLRHYLLAVQQLTRVPVQGALASWVGFTPALLRASAPHFPGVGWIVGMAACVVFAVLSLALPDVPLSPLAAAAGSTIATVLLTGALHEEGLARFADGTGTGTRNGTLAIVLIVAAKLALVAVLGARSPGAVLTALLAAHTVSRFWPLVIVHLLPIAASDQAPVTRPWADRIDRRALAVAAAWCVLPLVLMALAHGVGFALSALVASGALLAIARWRLAKRPAGAGADAISAVQQACEVAFYLGAALGLSAR